MILQGHYQNAYVTHDLEAAMALMSERFGLGDYITFDLELPLTTPDGTRAQRVKVAAAWTGWTQIELIEPVSGYVEPFAHALPEDKTDIVPRLHHISLRRDDLDAMRAEADATGLPFVCEGGVPDIMYRYHDARGTLGHFVEFLWATPAGWEMLRWPEGRPVL